MDFDKEFKKKREEEKLVKERRANSSKERLKEIASKKVKTTMIGALSAIEKKMGFLWENDSEQAVEFRQLYESIREEILTIGNNQMRNLSEELNQYTVEWQRYRMNLPVIKRNSEGKNG